MTKVVTMVAVLLLAACAGAANAPASAPSTDVNPVTGSRGGSGAR